MKFNDDKSGMQVMVFKSGGSFFLEISPMKALTLADAKSLRPLLDDAISETEIAQAEAFADTMLRAQRRRRYTTQRSKHKHAQRKQ